MILLISQTYFDDKLKNINKKIQIKQDIKFNKKLDDLAKKLN